MSKRTDREFLSDIREAINRITAYVKGIAYPSFLTDTKTQDAVIRNLEILAKPPRTYLDHFVKSIQLFLGRI